MYLYSRQRGRKVYMLAHMCGVMACHTARFQEVAYAAELLQERGRIDARIPSGQWTLGRKGRSDG